MVISSLKADLETLGTFVRAVLDREDLTAEEREFWENRLKWIEEERKRERS